MLPGRVRIAAFTLAILVLSGCSAANEAEEAAPGGVDPEAPVAAGYPAMPLPGERTPLQGRSLSGLYASPPSADTLAALETAEPSPDGLFRALLSDGEIWVTRIDGAWIWQVALPPVSAAGTAQGAAEGAPGTQGADADRAAAGGQAASAGGTAQSNVSPPLDGAGGPDDASPAAGGAAPTPVGPLQWTPESTLLFRDSAGRWLEADPLTAQVKPLGAALNGVAALTLSPDGREVLYYKGNRLYRALRDGSQEQLVGENVIGHWDSAGQLVVTPRPVRQAEEQPQGQTQAQPPGQSRREPPAQAQGQSPGGSQGASQGQSGEPSHQPSEGQSQGQSEGQSLEQGQGQSEGESLAESPAQTHVQSHDESQMESQEQSQEQPNDQPQGQSHEQSEEQSQGQP
ncbi:MAG: hypothetical protein AB2385_03240 [Symbiobacterium sp.]|uniref:hypothetical protein n=1 Tax=Symbiobacterium sp. TaxID=1971213 RepID=UPI0034647457